MRICDLNEILLDDTIKKEMGGACSMQVNENVTQNFSWKT